MAKYILVLMCVCFAAVFAQDVVPCLTTRDECSTMTSGLMVVNNQYYCCRAGYSMSSHNGDCTCRKTSEVKACDTGAQTCRAAGSVSTNSNGEVRCCQLGYSMQSVNAFINGRRVDSCTCSRSLFGGVVGSSIVVDGNSMIVSGNSNWNATEFQQKMDSFRQRMQDWGQRFSASMRAMGDRLRHAFSFGR